MTNLISDYEENGFIILKKLVSERECNLMKSMTAQLTPKLKIPFSDVAWGFGDVRNIKNFEALRENKIIKETVEALVAPKCLLSHFLLVNKAAWIGPDVEWHQEVFNMSTYAPGINPSKDWKRFIQVFIALDDQNIENGCLKVFKGSHKSGIQEYEDLVNINQSHKRRVTIDCLEKLYKKHEIIDLELQRGDALFFNHLLVHGSASNISPHSRLSALLQYYDESLEFDNEEFEKQTIFRTNFISSHLEKSLSTIGSYKEKLKDFKK